MKHFVLSLVAMATLCVPVSAQNRVKNLYASFNKLNVEQLQDTEQTVQLSRYLFAGYNTLCLPMSVRAEQLQKAAEGVTLERFVGMQQEGNTLCLYFLDCTNEGVEAGIPYLIRSPKSMYLRIKNTEADRLSDRLQTVRLSDENGNTVSFGSSWETVCEDGLYGIPAKQDVTILESVLIRTQADKNFLPTRCGFDWEQHSKTATELTIRHIRDLSEISAVPTVNASSMGTGATYDLNGRRVGNTTQKGIVIQDGRKVIR